MMAPAAALGPEIYAYGFRFSPTPQEAVTYYLPRLVSGDPLALHEVVRHVIHRADVYACDPAELARRFRPMPRTHNRFFFTVVKKGVRAAGPGSWAGQSTTEIKDKEGVQIGQLKKFRYKKRGDVLTDWLMEEYSSSCGLGTAAAGGGGRRFALCKVYVSPKAALDSDAYKESAAAFSPMPPPPAAVPAVITPTMAAKRPMPPQDATPPCAKRMRGLAVQPAPPPPPAAQAPILSSHTVVRKMPFAPPQPCVPRRGLTTPPSATQPSPASALPPVPPAPTRPHLAAVRNISFTPPQPCPHPPRPSATRPSFASAPPPAPPAPSRPALHPRGPRMPLPTPPQPCPHPPRRSLTTPSTTQPSLSVSAPPPARPAPTRPALQPRGSPMPLPAQHKQQGPLPTPPVASARHMPQQAPAPPCLTQVLVQPTQRRTILDPFEAPAKLQDDDDDDFAKEIEDLLSDEAEEQTVAAAPTKLQDDDDDFAKVLDDMLSAEAEEPTVEFDLDAFFNFSEEDLEATMLA